MPRRQEDREHRPGALPRSALQLEQATVPPHNVVAHPQPQSRARLSLSRHKGLEDSLPDVLWYAAARVGHHYANPTPLALSILYRLHLNPYMSSRRRSVDRIAD